MVRIWYEVTEEGKTFAHITSDQGVLGTARIVKQSIPKGVFITIPPKYQPTLTKWLTKHCGFIFILSHPADGESEPSDVLLKVEV